MLVEMGGTEAERNRKRSPYVLLVRMLMQTLWKSVWRFFKKLKIEIPYDSGIPLLKRYTKNQSQRYLNAHAFVIELFTIAKL
jgi:hypothetical protein